MTDKLKPCPFCGSNYVRLLPQTYGYSVDCQVCQAMKMTVTRFKRSAIDSWNMRREPEPIAKRKHVVGRADLQDLPKINDRIR